MFILIILIVSILGGGWIALLICFAHAFKTTIRFEDRLIKEMKEYREHIKDIKYKK